MCEQGIKWVVHETQGIKCEQGIICVLHPPHRVGHVRHHPAGPHLRPVRQHVVLQDPLGVLRPSALHAMQVHSVHAVRTATSSALHRGPEPGDRAHARAITCHYKKNPYT